MNAAQPRPERGNPSGEGGLIALDGGARCMLVVRAQPGARRSGFAGFRNGLLKIAVTAPPADGRANEALRAELARLLGLRAAAVQLVGGASAREKRFEIAAPAERVAARIAQLAAGEERSP